MRVVTETREKVYAETFRDERGKPHTRIVGKGIETVSELKLCHQCMGLDPPAKPKPEYRHEEEPQPSTLYELVLANGKSVKTNDKWELVWFYASDGNSIAKPPKRKKGGKSKGARNKTKSKVTRTRDAR